MTLKGKLMAIAFGVMLALVGMGVNSCGVEYDGSSTTADSVPARSSVEI